RAERRRPAERHHRDRCRVGAERSEARRREREDAGPQHDVLAVGQYRVDNDLVEQASVGEDLVDHWRTTRRIAAGLPNSPVGRTRRIRNSTPKMSASATPDDK